MGYAERAVVDVQVDRLSRGSVRYPLHLPVILLADGGLFEAVTEDISSSGVLFQLRVPLNPGQQVEFLVEIPIGTLNFGSTAALQCWGRIVRAYWKNGTPWAAAIIEEFRFQ